MCLVHRERDGLPSSRNSPCAAWRPDSAETFEEPRAHNIYIYIYVHTHIYIYTDIQIYRYTDIQIYRYIFTYMQVSTSALRMHTHVCTHTNVWIYRIHVEARTRMPGQCMCIYNTHVHCYTHILLLQSTALLNCKHSATRARPFCARHVHASLGRVASAAPTSGTGCAAALALHAQSTEARQGGSVQFRSSSSQQRREACTSDILRHIRLVCSYVLR